MRKKANTVIELLAAAGIASFVLLTGISVAGMMSHNLYTGQIEYTNSDNISEVIFCITREIQSAEYITVSPDGKQIDITERDGSVLQYSYCENYPTGYMAFKGKHILDADYEKSGFTAADNTVTVTIASLNNNTDTDQIPKIYTFNVNKRTE